MKKVFFSLPTTSLFIAFFLASLFLATPQAQAQQFEEGFLDALINVTKQDNYRTRSGAIGQLVLETQTGPIEVNYRLNINGNTIKQGLFSGRGYSLLGLHLDMKKLGEQGPFDTMALNLSAQTVGDDQDLYLRVSELNISGENYSADTEAFVDKLMGHFQDHQDQWLLMSEDSLRKSQTSTEEEPEEGMVAGLQEGMEEGAAMESVDLQHFLAQVFGGDESTAKARIMMALEDLFNQLDQSSYYYLQREVILEAVTSLFQNESLFIETDLSNDAGKDHKALRLSTFILSDVLAGMSELLGQPLTDDQQEDLDDWLSPLFLNISYKTDRMNEAIESMLLQFRAENIGSLKEITTIFYFQTHGFGNAFVLNPPSSSVSIDPILTDLLK